MFSYSLDSPLYNTRTPSKTSMQLLMISSPSTNDTWMSRGRLDTSPDFDVARPSLILFNSFVQSVLDYCSKIWPACYNWLPLPGFPVKVVGRVAMDVFAVAFFKRFGLAKETKNLDSIRSGYNQSIVHPRESLLRWLPVLCEAKECRMKMKKFLVYLKRFLL